MANFDMKKLSTGDRVVAGASVIALISLFLPWYGVSTAGFSASVGGFSSGFGWLGALLIIASGAYLVMLRSGSSLPRMPYGPGVMVMGTSLIGTVIVALRWLTLPSGNVGGIYSYGPRVGIYLTVLVGVFQAVYATRLFRGSGESLPWAAKSSDEGSAN